MSKEKVIELLLRGALQATAATITAFYTKKLLNYIHQQNEGQ